jgi:hypothetical protein
MVNLAGLPGEQKDSRQEQVVMSMRLFDLSWNELFQSSIPVAS